MTDLSKYDHEIEIIDLDEKGYGIGYQDHRKYFVLNSLPGEKVFAKVVKKRKQNYFAFAETIISNSNNRVDPVEDHFTSCSPLQILNINSENSWKKKLIARFFKEYANFELQDFEIESGNNDYHYRNKVEFSFYGDEESKLHLAFHKRDGRNAKQIIAGCKLVPVKVNRTAQKITKSLNNCKISARQLKGLTLRYSFNDDKVIALLWVKDINFDWEKVNIENEYLIII